ncbi:MAG: 6-phosphofructokinase [Thermoflexales bacterium]|nr:6-phosphofructokinase [Thermoflexales bacterium]
MRIGILTGGGDVPGLNPAIKSAVERMLEAGHEVVGIRRGWAGLLNYDLDEEGSRQKWTLPLDMQTVRTIDRTGGTFLHTSRTNPGNLKPKDVPAFLRSGTTFGTGLLDRYDFTPHVLSVLKALGLEGLIAIGGDDTLSYALRLHNEGLPIVAIPKTMDNDVRGTDYCIGFSTAITRSVEFIHNLRTCAGSHERVAVVELFGRNSGETSLVASYLADTDRCLISEVPFDIYRVCDFLKRDKDKSPSNYCMVTISEGARQQGAGTLERGEEDAYGHRKLGGIGDYVAEMVKKLTGENTIYQNVAYLMRSGAPDVVDLMVGRNYGTLAADLILSGKFGRMVGLSKGAYTHVPLTEVGGGSRPVDVEELYDAQNYRPRVKAVDRKPMFLY